jgi:hypothetical protein
LATLILVRLTIAGVVRHWGAPKAGDARTDVRKETNPNGPHTFPNVW